MNLYTQSDSESSHMMMAGLSMFVAGAALGAATAIAFAPASGRDTRAYIRRRGNEVAHDAVTRGRDAFRTQSDRVASAFTSRWHRASDAFRQSRELAE